MKYYSIKIVSLREPQSYEYVSDKDSNITQILEVKKLHDLHLRH
jgi:hypothetical protein